MSMNVVLPHFAPQDGYVPISFRMQWRCLGCGAIETSKFIAATRFKHLKGMIHLDGKKHKVCEAAKSFRSFSQGHSLSALAKSDISAIQTAKRVFTYRFRTETGEQLKVLVEKKDDKYRVHIEVLSLQFSSTPGDLVMSWGIFRSDSSCLMPLDFQGSGLIGKYHFIETPFEQVSFGTLAAELEYESSLAPFYISFLLKSQLDSDAKSSEIRSHRKKSFVVPVGFGSGSPAPLGLSFLADGSMNFALFSRSAESVVLCLYNDITTDKPALEIDLDPYVNRSGDIWHISMERSSSFVKYGYRCQVGIDGKHEHVLLDPYAKVIGDVVTAGSQSSSGLKGLGQLCKEPPFDWGQEVRPCIPLEELIVYRLNVRRFTKDKSSKLSNQIAGTFSGITEKLHHFKDLGVNAVLLEPIFPFDEQRGPYFPWHFFSPGSLSESYVNTVSIIKSIKEMVKKLHGSGIEVFLEVVFTHTAQGGALREIDNSSYYYVKAGDALASKNALNCNFPIVTQMILDSLRHWVIEFHIDGFSFVNASSLTRGFHGESLSRPPLVEMIAFDPLLSKVKIIADSWDPNDMESKEIFFPHWKRWAEINAKFCYDVRNFLRGKGLLSNLATRLCGSGDIFLDGRGPSFSFNYITRNFGLSLVDLVSFSNTELASELSWNCGEEGPTNKASVLETRLKQIRNFLFILFVSLGVPVINMGDECGQSSGGSPRYDDRKPLDWNALSTGFGIQTMQFISFLSSLRVRRRDLFQRRNFLMEDNIGWYGRNLSPPRWDDVSNKFLAMLLKASTEDPHIISTPSSIYGDLFVVFNGANHKENIVLPPAPADMVWSRLVDTGLPFPGFFSADGVPVEDGSGTYEMKSYSCVLFEARSPSS